MNASERKIVGEIQDLVGGAKSDYQNDRSADRAHRVVPALERAFELCVKLLSKYPPEARR